VGLCQTVCVQTPHFSLLPNSIQSMQESAQETGRDKKKNEGEKKTN